MFKVILIFFVLCLTYGMTADMGRDVRHLHPVNLIIPSLFH